MKKFLDWLRRNIFAKNLILAACAIIILIFATNILLNLFTRHNAHEEVPDFTGMTLAEAETAAQPGKLFLEVNDSLYVPLYEPGVILSQRPDPGTEVKSGRRILVTTNAHTQRMVRIPYVTGVSLRQAKNNLEVAGFEIEKLVYRTDIATNYVLETRYGNTAITAGSTLKAEQGSGITLVVGMNPDESTVIVPKIVGIPYREAKSRLWEMGLNLGKVDFGEGISPVNRNDSRVWKQTPAQGSRVTLGTTVSLHLTLEEGKVAEGSSTSDKEAQRIMSLRRAEEAAAAAAAAATAEQEDAEPQKPETNAENEFF